MAIHQTGRQQKTAENRQRLIDVATDLFDQYGFDDVTVDDICARAELSKGSYYHLFKAKEDLLMLSEKTARSRFLSQHFVLDEQAPFHAQLLQFFQYNFAYVQTVGKELARSTYVSYIRTRREYPVSNTFYHITLLHLIERGLREGAFRASLSREDCYIMLHDWIIGLQIGWCIAPDTASDERYNRFIAEYVRGLLTDP